MILLRAATVSVADLSRSVALYRDYFDYRVVEEGELDKSLADSWSATGSAAHRYAILQPVSGAEIYLRLIQQPPVIGFKALRTYGWNAIEICVNDVMAVYERLQTSPFEMIGPPRKNSGMPTIHPMQVKGPDEEVIFLTQINADTPPFRLPRAETLIDQIFILVIGCRDMKAATEWFSKHVGLERGAEMEIAYTMLAKAYGKDLSTQYSLTTMTHDNDVFLEVDQYPEAATDRPQHSGMLPPGCAISTFITPGFGDLRGPWIAPPIRRGGPIYKDKLAGSMIGPDGALIEIVEA